MSDFTFLANVFQSTILLFGILIVLFWLWPVVRLDCFRQNMFAVRDELFDYAASGKIAFTHPAYRLLRQSMNGFIRYGHQVSFCQFLMTLLAWKVTDMRRSFQWETQWLAALASLDESTKADLIGFHHRSAGYVAERIILGSPVLMFSLLVSLIALLFHVGWKSARDLMDRALSDTAARSIDQRILDEEAARAAA